MLDRHFLKLDACTGLKLVNVGGEDINLGRLKIILGLIWTLILRYQIKGSGDDNDVPRIRLVS